MPFSRPTLDTLRSQAANDIATALPGADALLRFSNLGITGAMQASMANLHYGYLDWIAKQAVPFTATNEYLEGWAALKGVTRNPATQAIGAVTFNGTPNTPIPSGTGLVRGDGVAFTTTVAGAISANCTGTVAVIANADPTGLTGAFGNTATGVVMTISQSISGVQSNGVVSTVFVGGADLESDDSLRSRMLLQYQSPPQGGSVTDYIKWALAVPGVTRAWCAPNIAGAGTVVVYVMMDQIESAHGGFPQGNGGVSAFETRAGAPAPATGDLLTVANYIYGLQPVTPIVYVVAPIQNPVNFTFRGIPVGSQAAIPAAINSVFQNNGKPGGVIPLANIWSVVATIAGVNDFLILSPPGDITNATGQLPTVGAITFT